MRVHHLNCGCMCPLGGALFDGFSKGLTAQLVCHCLLLETDQHGLVLVDTGFGSRDIFYVVLFAALIRLLAPEAGLLGLVLVLSAALIHLLWIVLLITTIVAPKPPEE